MKRKAILLASIASALVLSSVAFVNKESTRVDAATLNGGQLYVQVTTANDLRVGDTVIFGSGSNMFTYLAGNPIFSTGKEIPGHNNDYTKYYFSSSDVIPWVVEDGVADNTYSFRSIKDRNLEKNLSHPTNGRYLAYGHNYSGPGYSSIQAYGDINTSASKNNDSSWTVKFDNNGYAHTQRYGEPYQWSEGADTYTEIQFRGGGTRPNFGYYQDSGKLKIYRKVDFSFSYGISIEELPDKVNYIFGENSKLDGLEMEVTFFDDRHPELPSYTPVMCTYANEPDFFTPLAVSYSEQCGYFSWCGLNMSFDATVTHDKSNEHRYSKSGTMFGDIRGSFVLGFEYNNRTHIFNISSIDSTPVFGTYSSLSEIKNTLIDTTYYQDGTSDKIDEIYNNVFEIVVDYDDEDEYGYYIKYNNKYLNNNSLGALNLVNAEPTQTASITKTSGDGFINAIGYGQGSGTLAFNKVENRIEVADSYYQLDLQTYIPLELYRLDMTPNLDLSLKLAEFKDKFYSKIGEFDPTGETKDMELSDWISIRDSYNALDLTIKGILGSITYNHNHEQARSLNEMIDIYDTILDIYQNDGFGDFMERHRALTYRGDDRMIYLNGTNCALSANRSRASYQNSLIITIIPSTNYVCPDYVNVLMGEQPLREDGYTYDKSTGTITILQYVVVDNITVTIEAERQSAHAANVISNIATVPYLSYDYSFDGNNYTFDNVIIRFRGIVSKALWDELDGDDNNIQGYGILLSTEAYLGAVSLQSLYDQVDGTNVKKFYLEDEMPTLLSADRYDEIDVDSYSWNLKKIVGNTPIKINRVYVATTFIVTRDYGVIFLGQATASVRSLANDMIASDKYDETSLDGSLNYLANLEE